MDEEVACRFGKSDQGFGVSDRSWKIANFRVQPTILNKIKKAQMGDEYLIKSISGLG